MRNRAQYLLLAVLCITVTSRASEDVEDEADAELGERCINSRTIRRTDVVDDSNVVFYMRGTRIYLNTLPKACKGLADERRFTYGSYTRSLCEFDRINVLKDSSFGAYEGRSCKLGRFQAVTEEEAAFFFNPQLRVTEPVPVDPPPVEEFVIDDPESDEPR
jgi:hypothetical protein